MCLLSSEWQGLRAPPAAELGAAAGAGGDGEIMQRCPRGEHDPGEGPNSSTELICILRDLFVQNIH